MAAGGEDAAVAEEAGDAPLRLALDGEPRLLTDGEEPEREVAVRLVPIPPQVHDPF